MAYAIQIIVSLFVGVYFLTQLFKIVRRIDGAWTTRESKVFKVVFILYLALGLWFLYLASWGFISWMNL